MSISAAQVARDITTFGAPAIAVLEIVENTVPAITPSDGVQAIIAAIIAVLTGVLSISKQNAVATALAKAGVNRLRGDALQ